MKLGVFATILIKLHVQRSQSYYLKWKHKNVEKVNLIKISKTLVEWLNIVLIFMSRDWDKQKKIFNQQRKHNQSKS